MGQPEGPIQASANAGSRRVVLARPSGRLYGTAMRVRGAKIPLFSYLLSPLRVPEGPQRFGMGPRNQHDGYRLDGPTRRQSGPAIHPPGLRLERQAFLDSRGAAVPSGPLHHRGRGSGLGWERRQSDFDKLHCRHVHWRRQSLPSK